MPTARHRNFVLAALPRAERERLLEAAQEVEAPARRPLISSGDPVPALFFPTEGMASLVAPDMDGSAVEVLTTGREGIVGVTALFGLKALPFDVVWQFPSRAVTIDLADAHRVLPSCPRLRLVAARYLGSMLVHSGQNVICNRIHSLEQRAAKWLLVMGDRADGEDVPLTQEQLAQMLGVSRPKLSGVERRWRAASLVGARRRGVVDVIDRAGLENRACPCYSIIRDEMASWLAFLARPEDHGWGPPGHERERSTPDRGLPRAILPERGPGAARARALFVVRTVPPRRATDRPVGNVS